MIEISGLTEIKVMKQFFHLYKFIEVDDLNVGQIQSGSGGWKLYGNVSGLQVRKVGMFKSGFILHRGYSSV